MYKIAFEPHLDSINEAYVKYFSARKNVKLFLLKKPRWKDRDNFKIIKMILFLLKNMICFSMGKYDLVHINGANFGIIAYFASFFKCKYIYTIHGCPYRDIEKTEGLKKNILSYINEKFMKIIVKRAQKVLTISKFSQIELWNNYKIKADVIYNGFNKFAIDDNIVTDNSDIIDGKKKVIFISVGRMIEYKNPFRVIDIFKIAKKQNPNSYLILIGEGILEEKVKKYINENNLENDILLKKRIDFSQMGMWYKKSKYFISGCDREGFGLAALEATACGCIPILPNKGAFPEIFLDKKYLYDVNNINKIRFIDLLEDDRKFLNNIVKKYSWENSIKKYEKIYINLCNIK